MAKYLSEDLRIRVIRAVEAGASRRQAAERFGVSVASAVRWVREWRATGQTAPRPRGGDRRSGRIEAQADFLLAKVDEAPDTTLSELREALRDDRGLVVAISTLWRFFERRRVTFKKRRPTRASRTART
jgi:transposase